jgi:hypothetical protein
LAFELGTEISFGISTIDIITISPYSKLVEHRERK